MRRIFSLLAVLSLLFFVGAGVSFAYDDTSYIQMNYQGYLTNAAGVPLTGSYDLVFSIYDSSEGGTLLWSEPQSSVPVEGGIFSVNLGSIVDLAVDVLGVPIDPARWLEVKVGTEIITPPRTRMASAPYAGVSRRVSGDISTASGYLKVAGAPIDPIKPAFVVDAAESTVFFGANMGQEDWSGFMFLYHTDIKALTIGDQGVPRVALRSNTGIDLYNSTGMKTIELKSDSGSADFAGDVEVGGTLGVGVTGPTEKLDVNGTARLRGITTGGSSPVTVKVDADGKLWKESSSKRYKNNIRELDTDAESVLRLHPVRFDWKTTGEKDIGLIAEDVEKILPDLVIYDSEGRPEAVKYDKVAIYLLAAIRELKAENDALKDLVQQILAEKEGVAPGKEKMANKR